MSIHLIITFEASAARLSAFAEILRQVKAELPQVPGCQAVRVFNSSTDKHVFTLVETWDSESAHRAHIERVVEAGAWDHIRAHLAADPVSNYYLEV